MIPKEYVTNGSQKIEEANVPGVLKVTYDKSGKEIKTFVSLENASVKDDKYYVNDTILAPGDTIVDSVTTDQVTLSTQKVWKGLLCKYRILSIPED